jgi:hypothetical protein
MVQCLRAIFPGGLMGNPPLEGIEGPRNDEVFGGMRQGDNLGGDLLVEGRNWRGDMAGKGGQNLPGRGAFLTSGGEIVR